MNWKLYRWVWQLDSSMYIGYLPTGSLNRTRLYVPTRAIWGALTAELARVESNGSMPNYEIVGKHIRENTRISYMYPAEYYNEKWYTWLPNYEESKGLLWENEINNRKLTERQFRRTILHTCVGTAINPISDAALDNSLHETECLQQYWQFNDSWVVSKVAMVGYIFTTPEMIKRLDRIQTLFIGGDTRYGLGKITRCQCNTSETLFNHKVKISSSNIEIVGKRVLGHAHAEKGMIGSYELLTGWNNAQLGLGDTFSAALWTPGSCSSENQSWEIDLNGIWQRKDNS